MIGLLKTLHVLCAVMVTGMGFGVFVHIILLLKQGQERQSLQLQIVALCSSFILFFPALIVLILSGFYLSYLNQFLMNEPWIIIAIISGIIFGTLCLSIAYFCLALPFQEKSSFLKIACIFSCIGWIGFAFAMAIMILKRPVIG